MLDTAGVEEKGEEILRSSPVERVIEGGNQAGERGPIVSVNSVGRALKRILSNVSSDDGFGGVSREPSARSVLRRSHTFTLSNMSAAEVTTLMQQTIYKESFSQRLRSRIPVPVLLWFIWMCSGTIFFALYDDFGWAKGFLMSVNIGWSIAWVLPGDSLPSRYTSPLSKLVSIVHTTIGALFLGVAVLYMARDLMDNKDSWIVMASKRDEMENDEIKKKTWLDDVVLFYRYYISKLRVAKWSVVLIAFGCLWYSFADNFDSFFGVIDFIASTLCAGGYRSLDDNSNSVQYVVTALYAAVGIPLFKISLGLLLSLVLTEPEDELMYQKMVAPVTQREQEFMEAFGIDDGDGYVDYKEYVILMAVRMGSVPPHLVKEIQDKFEVLDRKRCGEILYSDMIMPTKGVTRKARIENFVGSAKSLGDSFSESIHEAISRAESFQGALSRGGSFRSRQNSVDITATPNPDAVVPVCSLSPSSSGKVLPFDSLEGEGSVVVVPRDTSRPNSQVTPLNSPSWTENENEQNELDQKLEKMECDRNNNDHQLPLRVSASIESLENIQLPDEKKTTTDNNKNNKNDDNDDDKDDNSICSIETFDGNRSQSDTKNNEPCHVTSPRSVGTAAGTLEKSRSEVDEEDEEDDECFDVESGNINIKKESEYRDPSESLSPVMSIKQQKKAARQQTFRAAMSQASSGRISGDNLEGGVLDTSKMTARQKEFFDEQEKLRNAQLLIDQKNNMSSVVYFFHHQLIPNAGAIAAWALWWIGGAVFYTIHEDVSTVKGLYMSTSIGYGIFWIELKGDPTSNIYSTLHFLIGIGVITAAMSLLAQNLLSQDKNWYSDAMKAKKLEEAMKTEGWLDDIFALLQYYWPHVRKYNVFFIFVAVGATFAAVAFDEWGTLDCLYFAISTMSSGGFVVIPTDAPDWCYLFVCFYVAIGVPVMSISCGILAHQIASQAGLKVKKVHAQVTPEEIEMMKWYGIEDGSGAIDVKEYVILILVRIGAISPEVISVLQDRFDQFDTEKTGNISYDMLRGGSGPAPPV